MEFVSISRILKVGFAQYSRSYLYTENDGNDGTYFLLYQLQVILRAIEELLEYLKKKSDEHEELEEFFQKSVMLHGNLNHRQIAALSRAIKNPGAVFTIKSHRGSHNVTYQTARTDLLRLSDLDFLVKQKRGKEFVFLPNKDLRVILKNLENDV
jgi:Fic family protein